MMGQGQGTPLVGAAVRKANMMKKRDLRIGFFGIFQQFGIRESEHCVQPTILAATEMVHRVGFFIFFLPVVAGECLEFGINLNLVRFFCCCCCMINTSRCFSVFIFNPVFKRHTKKLLRYSLKN